MHNKDDFKKGGEMGKDKGKFDQGKTEKGKPGTDANHEKEKK